MFTIYTKKIHAIILSIILLSMMLSQIVYAYNTPNTSNPPKAGEPGNGAYAEIIPEDIKEKCNNLYDIDVYCIKRKEKTFPKYWDGWTEGNMVIVDNNLQEDWYEMFGITDASSSLVGHGVDGSKGSNLISDSQMNRVLNYLKAHYGGNAMSPDMKDRLRHVESAMYCVGRIGYSQLNHGNRPILENNNHSGDGQYGNNPGGRTLDKRHYMPGMITDCSGFCSNIWYDRLNKYIGTTATFHGGGYAKYPFSGGAKPGDILISKMGAPSHALIYVGFIPGNVLYENGSATSKHYSIDCSTMSLSDNPNNMKTKDFNESMITAGNVRFASRNSSSYYTSCLVIDMTPLFVPSKADYYNNGDDTTDIQKIPGYDDKYYCPIEV